MDTAATQKRVKAPNVSRFNCFIIVIKSVISCRNETDMRKCTDGRIEVNFCISGRRVCKDFFRKATGFSKQMFNAVYHEVVNGLEDKHSINKLFRAPNNEDREDEIIAFLDSYFKSEATITGKPLVSQSMKYVSK